MNEAPKRRPGEVREDGMVFRGYRKGAAGPLEHWVSPESYAARKEQRRRWAAEARERWKDDPEKTARLLQIARESMHRRRRAAPEAQMLARARIRAKERGVPFELTLADILIPANCPVLGLPLRVADGCADDSSPELDRIVPARGYVRGNVIVISRRANRIKSDATPAELRAVADFYGLFEETH